MYDVLIAGAGVIGAMAARELSRYQLSVLVLEKESDAAMGASKANSGIIHAGYDPVPGTLKAEMNVKGAPLLFRAAKELNVPFRQCGALVVAFTPEEEETLKMLFERGRKNGVKRLALISGKEARHLEPALSPEVTLALNVPKSGIISPYELVIAALGNAMDNGVEFRTGFEIASVQKNDGVFSVKSKSGEEVKGKYFINCAGAFSDRVAKMAGDGFFTILPRAGEYLLLDRSEGETVSRTVFQTPTAAGKGVLVTPTVHGNLLLGPTATPVSRPDDTKTSDGELEKVRSLAKKSVPSVDLSKTITSFSGVRASEKGRDFILCRSEKVPGLIHAAAIDSPGLSSAPAIAQRIAQLLKESGAVLKKKPDWDPVRRDVYAFSKMTDEEKNAFILSRPEYGKIVCRCEGISEGEILDAIRQNPPAHDVDGVKRRVRAGMGRCQGGFCTPGVMALLAGVWGVPMEEITKKGGASKMVTGTMPGEEEKE